MGEELTKTDKRDTTEVAGKTDNGTDRTSSNDTRTTATKRGRRNRTDTVGTGADTGTAKSETESKKSDELVAVKDTVPKPEIVPPKKRGRKKKQSKPVTFSSEQIATLIMAVSGILSSKEGLEVFALTETECKQIAEPLSNIIIDMGYSETVGKYGNYIGLVTALLMILAPRFIIFSQQQKAKKIQKQGGLKLEPVKEERKTNGNSRGNNEPTGSTSKSNANDVLASIPSLA